MIMLRFVPGHEKIDVMAFAHHPCADQPEHNLIWSRINILWHIHTVLQIRMVNRVNLGIITI